MNSVGFKLKVMRVENGYVITSHVILRPSSVDGPAVVRVARGDEELADEVADMLDALLATTEVKP